MTIRENPAWQLAIAGSLIMLGLIIFGEAIQSAPSEDDAAVARPLRSRLPVSRQSPSSSTQKLGASFVLGALGVGLGVYALRQSWRQGKLLQDGVPVAGRIVGIRYEHDRERDTEVTYRFEDAEGVMHEGVYRSPLAGGLGGYSQGEEVTVIYDSADSRNHMLDVDNVRRAEAAVRRI